MTLLELLKQDGVRAVLATATDDQPLVLLRCLTVGEHEAIDRQVSLHDQARLVIAQHAASEAFQPDAATLAPVRELAPELAAACRELAAREAA